jgi:serine protease Do
MSVRTLVAAALLVAAAFTQSAAAATPSSDFVKRVRGATFEVVLRKADEGAVTYEKPLPLELLPFAIRNDKFWSVGTAFSIEKGTFVTAAHVLGVGVASLGGLPQLRDSAGKTYEIDRVLKFSLHEDFAVFTVKDGPSVGVLDTQTAPELDQTVYAVGNALGEGVVIRDGLLTSRTPENQDGRWQWLRYSAATSPGNSGGPLLDAQGKVIGVVIGKSPGENLNYALPIGNVLAAAQRARIDTRMAFRMPLLVDGMVTNYTAERELPATFADFERWLVGAEVAFNEKQTAAYLVKHADEILPRGKVTNLLTEARDTPCGALAVQGTGKVWEFVGDWVDSIKRQPDGSRACTRERPEVTMFRIGRPPGDSGEAFYSDSKAAMDLLLKEVELPRQVGTEKIIITSLGPATAETVVMDRFQRVWLRREWPIPYLDARFVGLFLPTPEGFAGLVQFVGRGSPRESAHSRLAFMADHFLTAYRGTPAQWRTFLARKAQRPPLFEGVTFRTDAATGFTFRSSRFEFSVPPTLFALGAESSIAVQPSFIVEGGKLLIGIGAVKVMQDLEPKTYVTVTRHPRPYDDSDTELNNDWNDMVAKRGDYVETRGHDASYQKLWRRAAIGYGFTPGAANNPAARVLYELESNTQNAKTPRVIDDMQSKLVENVKVLEK